MKRDPDDGKTHRKKPKPVPEPVPAVDPWIQTGWYINEILKDSMRQITLVAGMNPDNGNREYRCQIFWHDAHGAMGDEDSHIYYRATGKDEHEAVKLAYGKMIRDEFER